MYGDVRNHETMCEACNQWRAACVHCWAIAACVDAVARSEGRRRMEIYDRWGLGRVLTLMQETFRRVPRPPVSARISSISPMRARTEDRKARNEDAVQIGMAVARLGIDAFMWPADTPEKVEHNYRALLRGGYKPRPQPRPEPALVEDWARPECPRMLGYGVLEGLIVGAN